MLAVRCMFHMMNDFFFIITREPHDMINDESHQSSELLVFSEHALINLCQHVKFVWMDGRSLQSVRGLDKMITIASHEYHAWKTRLNFPVSSFSFWVGWRIFFFGKKNWREREREKPTAWKKAEVGMPFGVGGLHCSSPASNMCFVPLWPYGLVCAG